MTTINQKMNNDGRPSKQNKREKKITVRLTTTEHFVIRQKAEKAGKPLAVYLRESAYYANLRPRISEEERHFYRQIIGFANNLNQLTKLAHQQGLISAMSFFKSELNTIDNLLQKLKP